jgi:histidyl-tRNA synthetase
MLNNLGISDQERPAVLNIIDKSERRKPEQTLEDLEKIIGTRSEDTFTKIEAIKKIDSIDELKEKVSSCGEEGQKRANDWITLIEYLEGYAANNYVSIDLSIVRGLAYYTGFVYEAFEASGEGRALAGGGRYDHLVKKLSGNTDMPAAGFAIGDMTLSDCLESKGLLPNYIVSPDIYLICGPEDKRFGLTIISRCRKAGFSVNHSLKNAAFGKQFKEAGKSGARYALILGEEERGKNEIKIKDFRSGNEKSVSQKSLIQQVEIFDEAGGIS